MNTVTIHNSSVVHGYKSLKSGTLLERKSIPYMVIRKDDNYSLLRLDNGTIVSDGWGEDEEFILVDKITITKGHMYI